MYKPKSRRNSPAPRLTINRLRLLAILATLAVAALAVALRIETPHVWAFLGLVVSAILGQPNREA